MTSRVSLIARVALGSLMVSALPLGVQAAPLTIGHLLGHVTSVADPFGIVGGLVASGDGVTVAVRYDPAYGVDFFPADPAHGTYGSPGFISVVIEGLAFSSTSGEVLDMTYAAGQEFTIRSLNNPTLWPAGLPFFTGPTLALTFRQDPALPSPLALLSSDAPPNSLAFLGVPFEAFGLVAARDPQDNYKYAIEFAIDKVPEPPLWPLLVVAAVGWQARRRFPGWS